MLNEPTPAAKEAFLTALAELSRQHGIIIEGCGCCSSPSISLNNSQTATYVEDNCGWIRWLEPGEK